VAPGKSLAEGATGGRNGRIVPDRVRVVKAEMLVDCSPPLGNEMAGLAM
jgi:hypothetical protein